ncbi:MAG TPA: ATP-dependent RNA helicase [Candidatus Paceibacterota bacterium]|nr:ATP-dependent RNA helicase [Candidatus Paceibacterota bacterium]
MRLPIESVREEITQTIVRNQVTVVVGDPGCGKTTMLPYFLYKEGLAWTGRIGITQPRKIAAVSVSRYLAKRLGVEDMGIVAHKVRFEDATDPSTEIKFMTDGVLLREMRSDPLLLKYAIVVIDEAHERTANIDFLLGLLKRAALLRKDLKVVVASATIDAEKFSAYFDHAPVIHVPGRPHDVAIVWSDHDYDSAGEMRDAALSLIRELRTKRERGDVLVFLPGTEQIYELISAIEDEEWDDVVALPAHGNLEAGDLNRVFQQYPGKWKIVAATNIAETSITIEGIAYVIDSGLIRQSEYYPKAGFRGVDLTLHSQAGCDQRTGRIGRTGSGVCYRLFTKENFEQRPAYTETELHRVSLAGIVLSMQALGIEDAWNFPFIDMPSKASINDAFRTLTALGAVEADTGRITELGIEMETFPLEPHLSRMLLEARRFDCVEDIATIVAFLTCFRSVWLHPRGNEAEADARHRRFAHHNSDMLTLIDIWDGYEAVEGDDGWCHDHFFSVKVLKDVALIRSLLIRHLTQLGIKVSRTNNRSLVRRAVAAGLIYHLLRHTGESAYAGVFRNIRRAYIHPRSALAGGLAKYQWLVASEVSRSSRLFARVCSSVDPAWLPDLAPERFVFGARSLREPLFPGGEWTVRRSVEFRDGKGRSAYVGEAVMELVPCQRAKLIHSEDIRIAKENGWIMLAVGATQSGGEVFGTSEEGNTYRFFDAPIAAFEEGSQWYCSLDSSVSPGVTLAKPQFSVHRFEGSD